MRPSPAARVPRRSLLTATALLTAVVATIAGPRTAHAQILRIDGPREPFAWVGGGLGYTQFSRVVYDGATQSAWRFGGGVRYQASIEKSISNQSSLGLTGSYGRMPLRYYDLSSSVLDLLDPRSACQGNSGCRAHAQVGSLGVGFHAGGGGGIHQVIEGAAGVTRYSNFEQDGSATKLGATANVDGSLTVGYGVGYTLNRAMQFTVVQDYSAILHDRKDLPSGQSALAQTYTTRLSVRLGIGSRRSGI